MQAKYDLILITVLTFLFYGISWIAVKSGLLSKVYHRRFWNVLLLISFLVSAGLGVFVTFQINYDWAIPFADELTFWHVELGIALFWIAFFHVFWHLSYFLNLFKKSKTHIKNELQLFTVHLRALKWAAFSLGFTSFLTQVVFIREFLALFSGNELIIGVFFFNWLIITGLGAYAGKYVYQLRYPLKSLRFLLINLAVLPVVILFLMIYLKNKIFLSGTETGLTQIVFYSFFLLLPLNLFSGFLFALLSHLFSVIQQTKAAYKIYAYEAVGSIAAGVIFNFLLIYFADSFRTLLLLFPLNIFITGLFIQSRTPRVVLNLFALILFAVLFYLPLNILAKEFLFINQKIIYQKNSPYGNVILTENAGQINFYENGTFLFSSDTLGGGSGNVAENEEAVHFAMLQSQHPEKLMLISGGISGQLAELLKYPVKEIDYLEINPALLDAAKRFIKLPQDSFIHYINADARNYLQQTNKMYDVILINMPAPLTAENNRYYTLEFFKILKNHLNPEGIIKTQLPSSTNYLSEDAGHSFSLLYTTLSKVFKNVVVIPGEKDYFLASGKNIKLNFVNKIAQKSIENEYIEYYLDDFLLTQGSETIMQRLKKTTEINTDFKPLAYPLLIKTQLSRFKTNYRILLIFVLLLLIFVSWNMNISNFKMFVVGYASVSAELLVIFAFQVLYGNIYSLLSIIIMIFIGGLALGVMFLSKYLDSIFKSSIKKVFVVYALIVTALPYLFIYLFSGISILWLNYLLIFLLSLMISVLSGYIFYGIEQSKAGRKKQFAGSVYSADLFGSALAALFISLFFLPGFGLPSIGWLAGLFCIVAILFVQ